MTTSPRKMTRMALACMTPMVDSHEHQGIELPSYGIHRILAALVAEPELAGAETRLIDLECDDVDAYVDAIVSFEPQLLGMSLYVWSSKCLIEVARRVKQRLPECTIVFGGPSARPSVLDLAPYRSAFDYVDAVVSREGEQAIREIARALQDRGPTVEPRTAIAQVRGLDIPTPNGWQNTGVRPRLKNLDEIASPYQMGLMSYGAVGYLESFRGCPMSCAFCEWGASDISQGAFSEDYLTQELESLAAMGVPAVFNVDAGLNLNAQAFRNLAAAERRVGLLKATGLWCEIYPSRIAEEHVEFLAECGPSYLGVGLQSFNPELLKRMSRPFGRERFGPAIEQLSRVAANIEVQIIFGLPTDTWDGFLETLHYALSLPVTVRVYHCLVLPDALLTRGRPEWNMRFDPCSLSMTSCAGWSETELLDMRAMLSRETIRCGGTSGDFWWSFPPASKRTHIPRLSDRSRSSTSSDGGLRSA
ncbi:MAG: radical SAM protein [Planctomycetaceae bacterium]|nr:radical SAM protein [Planctomycetaceae bacterium]